MKTLEGNSSVELLDPTSHPMRIVVATNGDGESRGAVELAARLADRGAAVLAVAVVEPAHGHGSAPSAAPFNDESRCEVPDTVERSLRDVRHSERWTKRAFLGWPADVVNEAAENWDASLILVGLGSHRAVDRLFGTETALNVIKHAAVPVLAVPANARDLARHACAAIDFTPASIAAAIVAASLLSNDGILTLVHASPFDRAGYRPRRASVSGGRGE